MKRVFVVLLLIGCVPPKVPEPATVKGPDGPTCQGATYSADAPCLEKGDPAPFAGLLLNPTLSHAWLAAPTEKQAENDSLKKSNTFDVWLAAGAIVGILLAAYAGYEIGHSFK